MICPLITLETDKIMLHKIASSSIENIINNSIISFHTQMLVRIFTQLGNNGDGITFGSILSAFFFLTFSDGSQDTPKLYTPNYFRF